MSSAPADHRTRVLICDDSAVVRGLMTRWLRDEPDMDIVGSANHGGEAVRQAEKLKPDIIVLDVEMPEMDGIAAIPKLLAAAPSVRILMCSSLTRRNAEVTLEALALGAADYLPKPEAQRVASGADFRRELIDRIRALSPNRRTRPASPTASPKPALALRGGPRKAPEILVIGSSTGGPMALQTVIPPIASGFSGPILIVQHMPPMFTAILAEQLSKACGRSVHEAKDGEPVQTGSILVAPGDYHLRIVKRAGIVSAALDQGAPINFCRPAVDPLFQSAAEHFGSGALGLVLTGMGQDGRRGAEAICQAGGAIIVQDEATSVVWGMPGAIAQAGLASAIRPLPDIPSAVLAVAQGRRL